MNDLLPLLSMILGGSILLLMLAARFRADRVRSRLVSLEDQATLRTPLEIDFTERNWLAKWLFLAGFRSRRAAIVFAVVTILLAVGPAWLIYRAHSLGLFVIVADLLTAIPGGVGNVMVPFALAGPWVLGIGFTLTPLFFVRFMRRRRIRRIEADLPLILDLLNTLTHAGIGFDSALDRILASQPPKRPLVQELRSFQYDIVAGRPRVASLRRLGQRIEVPSFSTFVSAIIQAEQIGSEIAQTLRAQAEEFRSRRRERARAAALAVPTKLIIPMVIGFVPGVFVALLGPMMFEAFEVMDRTLRGVSGVG